MSTRKPAARNVANWVADLAAPEPNKWNREDHKGWKRAKEHARGMLRSWGLDNNGQAYVEAPESVDCAPEIASILIAHGYPGRFAAMLVSEGMGPEEVTERCKVPRNAVGSLGYTHGISSNYEPAAPTLTPGEIGACNIARAFLADEAAS